MPTRSRRSPTRSSPRAAPQKQLLASWVYYAMTAGQKFGAALDFAPIPKVVLKASQKSVKSL